jgi:capsule polysaccharide modification protein KpsS
LRAFTFNFIYLETILLFSRSSLVHLYGAINTQLSVKYRVIHVAYSDVEEAILKDTYHISDVINIKNEVKNIYNTQSLDLNLCKYLDELIIEQSKGRFNLNAAIQSDRTFQKLSYHDCLIMSQTYYQFWNSLIVKEKVTFLIHEPTSLYFNHIASIVCKKNNAQYITQISGYGENKYNFIIVSGDDGALYELDYNAIDRPLSADELERVTKYLNGFRAESKTFLSELSKSNTSLKKLIYDSLKVIYTSARDWFILKKENLKQPLDHLEIFLLQVRNFKKELRKKWSSYLFLKFDKYEADLNYYYYPLHLEPEAVVLYWGDGIYKNQVKLIENIAAQLPPDCYLYVKDHPHSEAYRDLADYRKMKDIPNLKLLNPGLSGKDIIHRSKGVITLNGTSGFEALLLKKQVYMFGNSFYSKYNRVVKINNIRDLRAKLYADYDKVYADDDDFYKFVFTYLQSTHNGFPEYFLKTVEMLGIDKVLNAQLVATGIIEYIEKRRRASSNESE